MVKLISKISKLKITIKDEFAEKSDENNLLKTKLDEYANENAKLREI
jgi:hypothetical protein